MQKVEQIARKFLGFETVTYRCRRNFESYCTTMEAHGLEVTSSSAVKNRVCVKCLSNSEILDSKNESLVRDFPAMSIEQKKEVESAFSRLQDTEVANMIFHEVNVGKLALYETLVRFKKVNLKLIDDEKKYFGVKLRQAMETVLISDNVLNKESPDVVACYSPQYAVTGAFAACCKLRGTRVIFLEGSANVAEKDTHLRLWDWDKYGLTQPAMSHLAEFESFELSVERKLRANKQLSMIAKARSYSVYSSKAQDISIYNFFNLDSSKKVVLLSMSSYDEVFSAYVIGAFPLEKFKSDVYESQIEWLRETIKWAEREDIQLIVRPHPREFPNKRESFKSEHADMWGTLFKDLPSCVRIDYPEFGFSLYDHLQQVDVVTTGWSFSGVEAMCAGIPVVTYDSKLPSYPASIHLSGESEDDYHKNLILALSQGRSEKIRNDGLRWLSFLSERGTAEIFSPSIMFKVASGKIPRNRYLNFLTRKLFFARHLTADALPSKRDVERLKKVLNGIRRDLF